jgi:hypothetical protein
MRAQDRAHCSGAQNCELKLLHALPLRREGARVDVNRLATLARHPLFFTRIEADRGFLAAADNFRCGQHALVPGLDEVSS